ncbi:MAG: type II toxin-antitoxin system Phd/YefM family antitoxin [Elusimicrobia bacterium]|nr:type II toxin-antitoxin system Phd/YefM family antitoxin [Elusimicrobiota bacterium]
MHAIDLLRAEHVGLRELKANMSGYAHSKKPVIATDHGKPLRVLVSYEDMVSILEMLRDLLAPKTAAALTRGRKAIESGAKGIPARRTLDKLR